MIESVLSFSASAGWAEGRGLVALGIVFFVGALAFLPRAPACIIGGLLFGLSAFPVALVGSTVGAVVAFLLSRYLFRSHFARITARRPRWKLIIDAVDVEGWRLLGLLRLASPLPGSASNYLFGLTSMQVWPYIAATFFGSAPQVLAFIYLGTAGRTAINPQSISTAKLAFTLAGCVLSILAVWLVTRRVKSLLVGKLAGSPSWVPAPRCRHQPKPHGTMARDGDSGES